MDKLDNPARRLHAIYTAFEEKGGPRNDQNKKVALSAWAAALDLDEKEELPELLAQFGVVVGMPTIIRQRISELPDAEGRDLLAAHLGKFEHVFSTCGLHRPVREYRRTVGAHQVESLLHIANALDRHGARELSLADDDVAHLLAQVSELFEEVRQQADLEPELRAFILRHLERIERALRRVQVEGVQGLREALEVLAAEVIVEDQAPGGSRFRSLLNSTVGVGAKMSSLASSILALIHLAEYAPGIADAVQRMLPPGQ